MSNDAPGRPTATRQRIAVVSEPGFAGVKRHVVDLLQNIDTARFEVLFIYSLARKDASYEDELQAIAARGVRCEPAGMVRAIKPGADLGALREICRKLRAFQPALVHAHSSKAGFLARLAARSVSRRMVNVYTPHLMACVYSRLFWVLERFAATVTDRIVAVSESEARQIRSWRLVPPDRVVCVPVSVKPLASYPTRKRSTAESPVIVACGRICRQKNALLFFQVAAETLGKYPHCRFRWIGDFSDDAEARAVRDLVSRNPHARQVEVTGWVNDANAWIADADLFCMLSRHESFGFVTADAMMMGVPVVATPATGTVDLVLDGVTGLLAEPTVSAVSAAIVRLLHDDRLRPQLIQAARERVSAKYSLSSMMRGLEGLYLELTSARAK